jgi:hypothetical protein
VFGNGEFAVVEDLDKAEDPCLPGKLFERQQLGSPKRQRYTGNSIPRY